MKKTLMMSAFFLLIISFIAFNIFKTAGGHVKKGKEVVTLKVENTEIKKENTQLKVENKQLKNEVNQLKDEIAKDTTPIEIPKPVIVVDKLEPYDLSTE
jgi:cell division protein FtsB